MSLENLPSRRSGAQHRWMRQLHLWVGAWGALAAVLYGFTGLVMNHRFGDQAWPQGSSEDLARREWVVPADAAASPEQLSLWLRREHGLESHVIRRGAPGQGGAPQKWTFSGGGAREGWVVDYVPSAPVAEFRQTRHSPLAIANRLHKAVGGGPGWVLLADSFAVGMVLLGLSGLWMWARGRRPRDVVLSVLALSTLAWALVLGPALS